MIARIDETNARMLYAYVERETGQWPFWFHPSYGAWADSMFRDTDAAGDMLFDKLETLAYLRDGGISGYVQFGVTAFTLSESGKDYGGGYPIIRSLYCGEGDAGTGRALLGEAERWFASRGTSASHAFFHYFGMSCHARMGKLQHAAFHLEPLLYRFDFAREHENALFVRSLTDAEAMCPEEIACAFGEASAGGNRRFDCALNGEHAARGEIEALPCGKTVYLRLFMMDEGRASQGVGARCMRSLLYNLHTQGYEAICTDTYDSNYIAQGFYLKTGFSYAGVARSYRRGPGSA